MIDQEILVLAIQKPKEEGGPDKGRLAQPSKDLLHAAGFQFEFTGRNLECMVQDAGQDYPLKLVLQHNREIARYVAEENADIAIVGRDRFFDIKPRYRGRLVWSASLNFRDADCNFQIGVYKDSKFASLTDSEGQPRKATLKDIDGQHVATEHPNALVWFAEKAGVKPNIHAYTGGVETARLRGQKFPFIVDITVSGKTMIDNGYILQAVVFKSRAGLIRRRDLSPEKMAIFQDIRTRLLQAQRIQSQQSLEVSGPEDEISTLSLLSQLLTPPRLSSGREVNGVRILVPTWARLESTLAS